MIALVNLARSHAFSRSCSATGYKQHRKRKSTCNRRSRSETVTGAFAMLCAFMPLANTVEKQNKTFLGYRKGPDGLPEIVPEEAEIVREIYKLFVQGKTVNWIATHLTSKGIPTPRGKEKWQTSTIESILTNEKYKGSAVLQKKFTVDFLSKKMKVNEGEVPQYIVDQSHPAIIDPEEWQKVQNEMAVRKAKGKHHNSLSPFSAKIVCGDCGEFYGSKV